MFEMLQIKSASSSALNPRAHDFLRDPDRTFSEADEDSSSVVMWGGPGLYPNSGTYVADLLGNGVYLEDCQILRNQCECVLIDICSPIASASSDPFSTHQFVDTWDGLVLETSPSTGIITTSAYGVCYGLIATAPGGLFQGVPANPPSPVWFSDVFAPVAAEIQSVFGANRREFKERVLRLIAEEPLEIGFSHPVENFLRDSIAAYGSLCSNWLSGIIRENNNRPSIVAAIVTCLGRLDRKTVSPWGDTHIRRALLHRDIEVRESAVRAVEMWRAKEFIMDLKRMIRREKTSWMADYIEEVIAEVEK
jgi:hypothetical protein